MAEWIAILKEWQHLRAGYKKKTEFDADYIGKCRIEHPDLTISKDILYRKYAAYVNNDLDGLIDHRGGHNRGQSSIDERVWEMFASLYLSFQNPQISVCYKRTVAWCETHHPELAAGIPSERSFRRRAEKELKGAVASWVRDGEKKCLAKFGIHAERNYTDLEGNDVWIFDNHTLDIISLAPNGKPHRMSLTAIQDAKSGVIVGFNPCDDPCSESTLFAMHRAVIDGYGLCRYAYLDNGSEFCAADIAGSRGHRTRASWNKDETPPAIFELLGIKAQFALVANPDAKNIERFFYTFKEHFSKATNGYCGGTQLERHPTMNKRVKNQEIPTDEEVIRLLDVYVKSYNSEMYGGKEMKYKGMSRIDVWNESVNSDRVNFRDVASEEDLALLLARSTRFQKIKRNGVYVNMYGRKIWFKNDNNDELKLRAQTELARRSFFEYCRLKAPDFYKPDREFLVKLCNEFQDFLGSDEEVMIINLPPRHGKSRTASCFVEWVLGRDRNAKIMTGSYNETLSAMFSKNVRNTISETKADASKTVYSDIFPGTRIKSGDAAMKLWSLEGGYNNYLATSPTGTATGFGCSLMIIDDLIKNAEEASNENVKQKHWEWFTNTMLSRREEGAKVIIIMTRWASDDLAGRAIEHYARNGIKLRHISMKALIDKENQIMLCPEILSYESYMSTVRTMGADIASANYQQEPIDLKGRLYEHFKVYTQLPELEGIYSYTDTADEGSDSLCSIIFGVYQREAYILDVYFTKEPMELTERETAARHARFEVNNARIESNNGGSGFARSVKCISAEIGNTRTLFTWFHQSKNKKARILSNASWVQEHIYFPMNWRDRFPEYHDAMIKYQREGKNAHDDAPDATTGVAEMMYKLGG